MADNSLKKGRYTKFSNKIGLYSNSRGSFVKNDTGVVLNFPFKDTVLEAGMNKEDIGREERFLQIEMDSKDIDTLEEPKVLTDFRYIDKSGEVSLTASSDIQFFDNEGNLKQNLLIKGNNLLALYTLRERLLGKVKLVYIDPPYNTGNDGFKYNDSFNHSAWLAFMKNRLETAKDLLSDDGSIFVQIDGNEGAYLKVLLDEIFGRENFRSQVTWLRSSSGKTISRNLSEDTDYILWYSKTENYAFYPVYKPLSEATVKMYSKNDNDGRGKYRLYPLQKTGSPGPETTYDFVDNEGKVWSCPAKGWRMKQSKLKALENDGRLYKESGSLSEKAYWNERATDGQIANNLWDDIANLQGANSEKIDFVGQKPEKLIKRIIDMTTTEADIVLDYHLGTGTTSVVAHKMNRRWVGVEQMDYIDKIAKKRLEKVISGEQGGISKDVGWNGGGSFVYFELKKYNQEYVERIMEATSLSELEDLYVDMRNNAFLKFWFDRSHFEKDEDFRQLDLDGRKQALADVLDENQLYLNYGDMNDTRHNVTADEKALTDTFYGTK